MILLRKLKGKKVNKLLIRLRRKGCIFYPIYEIVLVKNNNRAKSSSIEKLGYFNPHKLDRLLFINTSRLGY
jgi:ribosomal protein S16